MASLSELKISTLSGADLSVRLSELRAPLERLARASATPNVFYEPFMLFPAVEAYGDDSLLFVFVHRGAELLTAKSEILGFFPLKRRALLGGLLKRLELWQYLHCYLCNPLVSCRSVRPVMESFLSWLRRDVRGAHLMMWNHVDLERPEVKRLVNLARDRMLPRYLDFSYERAAVIPGVSAESYMAGSMSKRKSSKLKRYVRLLQEEKGAVHIQRSRSVEDNVRDFDILATIEHKSYKRELGTSILSSEKDTRYFRALVREGSREGKVICHGLYVDGKPVSYRLSVGSGGHHFLLKIAFDPEFARYSPGTVLEKHVILDLHGELEDPRAITLQDSCCFPEDTYLGHIWSERRVIGRQYIATGRLIGLLATAALALKSALKLLRRTRVAQETA